jgi:hypothetical protein
LARRVDASRCAESESQRPEVQHAVRTAPDKAWSIPLTVLLEVPETCGKTLTPLASPAEVRQCSKTVML